MGMVEIIDLNCIKSQSFKPNNSKTGSWDLLLIES